jgi:hypothetical protein
MLGVRVVVITALATLTAFAIALFFGIVGIVLADMLRGGGLNLANSYRQVAFPVALAALVIALVAASITEVRHYRRELARRRDYSRAA